MTEVLPHTPPSTEMTRVPELHEASLNDQRIATIDLAAQGVALAIQKGQLLPAVLQASRALRDRPAAAEAAIRQGIIDGVAAHGTSPDSERYAAEIEDDPAVESRIFDERELHRRAAIEKVIASRFQHSEEAHRRRALALAHTANSSYYSLLASHSPQPDDDHSGHDR